MSDRLLDRFDALLFDLDGTVFRGGEAVPGAAAAVEAARDAGVTVRFVTNNASRGPDAVAAHLIALGVAADAREVDTSARAAAHLLAGQVDAGAEVLVIGTDALAAEISAAGLCPVRKSTQDTAAVVQGLSQDTSWRDLAEACVAIRAGARWVACNDDKTLPSERGLLPGNGSFVTALRAATDREPVVAGKPQTPLMADSVRAAAAARPLVVGDRLDTDIEGATAAELPSLLVLSGVATAGQVLVAPPEHRPTYLAADISAITEPVSGLEIGPRAAWPVERDGDDLVVAFGEGTGTSDALDLLRALCAAHWSSGGGPVGVRAADDRAGDALAALGLGGDGPHRRIG